MAPTDRTSHAPTLSDYENSFVDVSAPPSIHAQSTPQSLSRAVWERRAEYTRPASIRIKVGTWNVAACPGVEKDIKDWFVSGQGVDTKLSGLHIGGKDGVEVTEPTGKRNRQTIGGEALDEQGRVVGGEEVGIYVLGLQEIVSLASAKEYIGRVYIDSGPLNIWKEAVEKAVPAGYECVAETQMSGLLLLIYASPEVAPTISDVSSSSVGTGVMGYLGNKGAVSTRIVLGETTRLVFINAHLASGSDKAHLDRRIWDWNQIVTRTKFAPVNKGGVVEDAQESLGEEDFAFVCGDLNFRLECLPGSDIRRLLMLHTKGEYDLPPKVREQLEDNPVVIHHIDSDDDELSDVGSRRPSSEATDLPDPDDFVQDPHNDPTSLQATLDSILPHDQLRKVQRQKKAFHDGWREGLVTFLPTYKYDVGSFATFDSSEKLRAPSWCDRILYRTKQDTEAHAKALLEAAEARKRDEEMKARGLEEAARQEEVIFDYDPANDGVDVPGKFDYDYDGYDESTDLAVDTSGSVTTKEGTLDNLKLDVYTSHQHITSSDHKPITALFTLQYLAVVPDLKAKVHQEVARLLDREENETRPTITILVDNPVEKGAGAWPEPTTSDAAMGINFGNVRYLQRKIRALTIANTGGVPATFSFISRPVADGKPDQIKPEWLSFCFVDSYEENGQAKELQNEVTLHPGDTITANLEIYVQDVKQVRALNTHDLTLDDILVLRVVDGRDYFVPIRGNWLQSCFGRSIPELIRIPPGGARALTKSLTVGRDVVHSAPKELFKLTEAIESLIERAIADKEMIEDLQSKTPDGWPFDTTLSAKQREENRWYCIEALESDRPLLESFPEEVQAVEKIEIISEILILFLGTITDGIIPARIWSKIEAEMLSRKTAISANDLKAKVLDEMSAAPNHHISLVFLTSMLGKVITERVPGVGNREDKMGHGLSKRKSIRKSIEKRVGHQIGRHGRSKSEVDRAEEVGRAERRKIEKRLAELFAPIVIGSAVGFEMKKKGSCGRKREAIEAFLVTG